MLVLCLLTVLGTVALAQPAPSPPPVPPSGTAPLLLVLDASGSMRGDDGTGRTKLDAAKDALLQLIDELPEGAPVGLRVYGHRVPNTDRVGGCADTELVAPVAPLDRARLRAAVRDVQATGYTPIGASLEAALGDLPAEGPRTVVLISDGIDTCAPPEPCDVARRLASEAVELRVESIGFQVDPVAAEQLRCIAEVTGGAFRPVDDASGLLRALREYQPAGTPVSGGTGPDDVAVLEPGQYLDTITVGQERWYAIDLERGELLRTVATLVGERGGPVSPTAVFSLDVGGEDVLGDLSCGRDEAARIGQEARQVGVDGGAAQEGAICREPGRSRIRLALADGDDPELSVLAGRTYQVELLLSVVSNAAPEPSASPSAAPSGRVRPIEPPETVRPAASDQVLAGGAATLLGLLVGAVVGRRMGT